MGEAIIQNDGFLRHWTWDHSENIARLYRARARDEAEEMTCAAQAVELLAPHVSKGDCLLDAGCGSGYFFHSLRRRGVELAYWGIDASPRLIEIGRSELTRFGLLPERLLVLRIEDFCGEADHVLCMNVLSNIDNYHRPLERLLRAARKTLILRESATSAASYAWVRDKYLNPGADLGVYVNAYDVDELTRFIEHYGFAVERIADRRSGNAPENVIGHRHWWAFFRAVRKQS
jgi:SAM-dependent methyltransferase